MRETLEFLVFLAFVGLILLLRLDAPRFGTAEYDDEEAHGGWRGWLRRLTWYALGIALVLLVYWLYPQPITVLHLEMGADRQRALLLGLAFGLGGTFVAFLYAWYRYGRFRLPAARLYPGALVNSVATAFIDEALFRGIILGLLLEIGWPPAVAIAVETILYGLATRLAGRGRSKGLLAIALGIGVVSGLLTVETLGIGAAVLGHAITRFSLFLATGHPGMARPPGWEPEEMAGRALPPVGWGFVGGQSGPGPAHAGWSPYAGSGWTQQQPPQGGPIPAGWMQAGAQPPPGPVAEYAPGSLPPGSPAYGSGPSGYDGGHGSHAPGPPSYAPDTGPYPAGPVGYAPDTGPYPAGPVGYAPDTGPYPAGPVGYAPDTGPYPAGPVGYAPDTGPYPAGPVGYAPDTGPYPAGPVGYAPDTGPYPAGAVAYSPGPGPNGPAPMSPGVPDWNGSGPAPTLWPADAGAPYGPAPEGSWPGPPSQPEPGKSSGRRSRRR